MEKLILVFLSQLKVKNQKKIGSESFKPVEMMILSSKLKTRDHFASLSRNCRVTKLSIQASLIIWSQRDTNTFALGLWHIKLFKMSFENFTPLSDALKALSRKSLFCNTQIFKEEIRYYKTDDFIENFT